MNQPSAVAGARNVTYSTDLSGKATTCTVPAVALADGKDTATTMTTSGNGWCGIPVRQNDQPYGAGLLVQAPRNGSVYVHLVGDDTRVDYIARPGTTGPDAFAVKFIPGDAMMHVAVINTAPPPAVAAPAAAPTKAPTRATTTRTTTTRSRTSK
ncbi:hypothetical protein [Acidisphaera sp. L21]|uniref:hypothetical protein n=1 Tax=Acidisphaera sp. L21 TaxID=1641851 RepID=UPI00131D57F1|nr:hypothetical protein [Acidisphaera sp. L21]